jgi:BirA family transcriptional regulator, biotin operon repressor / biotin---[acetyl-CoA-carboxylase] ligase
LSLIASAPVKHYATIDSTNTEAHRLFEAGERGPLWLLADEQTAGRGRLDRQWVSSAGNCYSTLMLPLAGKAIADVPQLGFVVSLAVADAIEHLTPAKPQLKWPNDVLINGAKVSGILSEVISQSSLTIAVGCGINVAHAPTGLGYPAVHLLHFASVSRDQVFKAYRIALGAWLDMWQDGFDDIRKAWLSRAIGVGETVSLSSNNNTIVGIFESLNEQGALLIRDGNNKLHTISAGDLTIPSLQALRASA